MTALLSPAGTVLATYYYDAFGVITEQQDAGKDIPFRYAGYRYDDESGLYYLKSRFL